MIKVENITVDNKNYTYTYSDANRYIIRDGISYVEAYDPAELGRTYVEGEIINENDNSSTSPSEAEEILNILMGDM